MPGREVYGKLDLRSSIVTVSIIVKGGESDATKTNVQVVSKVWSEPEATLGMKRG